MLPLIHALENIPKGRKKSVVIGRKIWKKDTSYWQVMGNPDGGRWGKLGPALGFKQSGQVSSKMVELPSNAHLPSQGRALLGKAETL